MKIFTLPHYIPRRDFLVVKDIQVFDPSEEVFDYNFHYISDSVCKLIIRNIDGGDGWNHFKHVTIKHKGLLFPYEILPSRSIEQIVEINAVDIGTSHYEPLPYHYSQHIPFTIFQTWHEKYIPEKMYYAIQSVLDKNPEYEYYFYTEEDIVAFIEKHYGSVYLNAFQSLVPYAYKSDFWRYLMLCKFGGIYLDIKMIVHKPFQCFIHVADDYVSFLDIPRRRITPIYNGFIGSVTQQNILVRVIERVLYNIQQQYYGENDLDITSCPQLTKSFNAFRNKEERNFVKNGLYHYHQEQINLIGYYQQEKANSRKIIYQQECIIHTYYNGYYRIQAYESRYSNLWKHLMVYRLPQQASIDKRCLYYYKKYKLKLYAFLYYVRKNIDITFVQLSQHVAINNHMFVPSYLPARKHHIVKNIYLDIDIDELVDVCFIYISSEECSLVIRYIDSMEGKENDQLITVLYNGNRYKIPIPFNDKNIEQKILLKAEQVGGVPFEPLSHDYNQKIPKKIYQTWSSQYVSTRMFYCIQSILDKNPEYEYYFFTDKDIERYIKEHFSIETLQLYQLLIPGAYRADFWRYLVLWKEGGFYLDSKMTFLCPLQDMVGSNDEFISFLDLPRKRITPIYNAFLGATANSLILWQVVEDVKKNISKRYFGGNDLAITGPYQLSKSFNTFARFALPHPLLPKVYQINGMQINLKGYYQFDQQDFSRRILLNGICIGFTRYKSYYNEQSYMSQYRKLWKNKLVYHLHPNDSYIRKIKYYMRKLLIIIRSYKSRQIH